MFEVGELIKRKTISDGRSRAVCVVVDKCENNYTLYNNSLKCLQTVAVPVINGLYNRVKVQYVCIYVVILYLCVQVYMFSFVYAF